MRSCAHRQPHRAPSSPPAAAPTPLLLMVGRARWRILLAHLAERRLVILKFNCHSSSLFPIAYGASVPRRPAATYFRPADIPQRHTTSTPKRPKAYHSPFDKNDHRQQLDTPATNRISTAASPSPPLAVPHTDAPLEVDSDSNMTVDVPISVLTIPSPPLQRTNPFISRFTKARGRVYRRKDSKHDRHDSCVPSICRTHVNKPYPTTCLSQAVGANTFHIPPIP